MSKQVLCLVALLLQSLAVGSDYWSVKNQKLGNSQGGDVSIGIHFGLWRMCADGGNSNEDINACKHIPMDGDSSFPKNSLYAVRVFGLLSVALLLIALIQSYYNSGSNKAQMLCLVGAGVCSLISMAIWAAEFNKIKVFGPDPTQFNMGVSFYINIIAGLVALVGAYQLHKNK